MIRGTLGLINNQFGIIQVPQSLPLLQISKWSGFFFAVFYSKPALVCLKIIYQPNLPAQAQKFGISQKKGFIWRPQSMYQMINRELLNHPTVQICKKTDFIQEWLQASTPTPSVLPQYIGIFFFIFTICQYILFILHCSYFEVILKTKKPQRKMYVIQKKYFTEL